MNAEKGGKRPLFLVGVLLLINMLLSTLIPSVIISYSSDMIDIFCFSGLMAGVLIAIHPIMIIFATIEIGKESPIRPVQIGTTVGLLIASMVIIPITVGYGVVLSPLLLFSAIGLYLHGRIIVEKRYLLYTGMGFLLMFYFGLFILFALQDIIDYRETSTAAALLFSLPFSTCILYLISLFLIFSSRTPEKSEEYPGEKHRSTSTMPPPPGWKGEDLQTDQEVSTPARPPGWG